MKSLGIDIETYSSVDLAKSGVYRYSESPDFEILLFGYAVDGGEVIVVDLANGEKIPNEILNALTDDTVIKWAYNANFERICISRFLFNKCSYYLNPVSWRCSMVWASMLGLPRSLEGVGAVLGLDKQKLTEGKELIRYFCVPCAPTKSNGGRTRNRPSDAPDKWERFKAYNLRDVETEEGIRQRLSGFPVSDEIWDEYRIDQEINDRGIAVDAELIRRAIEMDNRSHTELTEEMRQLTDLENPNSVTQMKQWLSENGLTVDSLGKKEVAEMLKTAPPELQIVLSLRQQLARSSVKKYTAMQNATCADGRARGMFQFYGANRTGRFSGKNIQLQNLPQNHLPDLAQARALVRSGDYETVEMLYGDVPDTLSQLIRTALIPKPGKQFIVADFSAIEARVIAWLAGERWKSKAFENGEDIYCSTASRMFGVPVEKHGVNSKLRQKGKVTELACIAEGNPVLTDFGLIPIEKVTTEMKLWDGKEWVTHDGVIFKGEREVITYEGLTATPDHLVFVEGKTQPIQFGIAAASGAHLIQTGNGRRTIRLGNDYQPRKKVEPKNEPLFCAYTVRRMRLDSMARASKSIIREIQRLSELFAAKADSCLALQKINRCKTALRKSKRTRIQELWCKGNKIRFSQCNRRRTIFNKYIWIAGQIFRNRQNRYKWELCARKPSFCGTLKELYQSEKKCFVQFLSGILAIQQTGCSQKAIFWRIKGRNNCRCGESRIRKEKKLAYYKRSARLYDIRNAGKHHRFTVSGKLVHNCGYGGSVGALKAMGALEMGLDETELQPLVNSWRGANPNITRLWWEVDRCVKDAVRYKTKTQLRNLTFECRSGMLFITLPSGRKLAYVKPYIEPNSFGGESVTYEGVGGTKKWERLESYGPKFVENIVQGIARDILCYAMKTLRHSDIVATVHDEIIIEADKNIPLESVCEQMGRTPPWADGLLLRADGYVCDFYKKD